MDITINTDNIPQELLIKNEDGTTSIDYGKIKTTTDVNNVLNAKEHLRNEFNQFKDQYKGIDINKYNTLLNQEFEANKDVLENPVYKNLAASFDDLKAQNAQLNASLQERDAKIFDDSLKDQIRSFKGVEATAIDDILYRAKAAGFTKTENGILSKDGKTVDAFLTSLQESAPHLFKRSVGSNYQNEKLQKAMKGKSLADVLLNSPVING